MTKLRPRPATAWTVAGGLLGVAWTFGLSFGAVLLPLALIAIVVAALSRDEDGARNPPAALAGGALAALLVPALLLAPNLVSRPEGAAPGIVPAAAGIVLAAGLAALALFALAREKIALALAAALGTLTLGALGTLGLGGADTHGQYFAPLLLAGGALLASAAVRSRGGAA